MPRAQERMSTFTIIFRIVQQLSAALGAFGLGDQLHRLIGLDWHGWLATMVGFWSEYVRPRIESVLDVLIVKPLAWAFDIDLQIPVLVSDYIALGVILALSGIRDTTARGDWKKETRARAVEGVVLTLLLWPVVLAFTTYSLLRRDPGLDRMSALFFFAPLIYLCIMIVVNLAMLSTV